MSIEQSKVQKVINYIKKNSIIRTGELASIGVQRIYLQRLYEKGILERTGRGIYVLKDLDVTENHTLAQVAKKYPNSIVCLLTALRFHELTTQNPFQVWIAIDRKKWKPVNTEFPVEIVRYSKDALNKGIEKRIIEGIEVKIYNPAKTVADCFKYRNKIGLDVAIEALTDSRRQNKCTNDELWKYAKICRVANVMRPYMEAIG